METLLDILRSKGHTALMSGVPNQYISFGNREIRDYGTHISVHEGDRLIAEFSTMASAIIWAEENIPKKNEFSKI